MLVCKSISLPIVGLFFDVWNALPGTMHVLKLV